MERSGQEPVKGRVSIAIHKGMSRLIFMSVTTAIIGRENLVDE
jgi:hypothetical protein